MPLGLPRLEGISPEGARDASKEPSRNIRTKDGRLAIRGRVANSFSAGEESHRGYAPLTSSRSGNRPRLVVVRIRSTD